MALTPVFIDFETFWSVTHSLTKMSSIEYVSHPDTEVQSCSIQVGWGGEAVTYFGFDAIQEQFDKIDWEHAWCFAHNNSEFDALVLAWRFHRNPKMWGCTLAMARPIHSKDTGSSLKALAKHYNLEEKGNLEAINTKGKYLADFTDEEIAAMRIYNNGDTRICCGLAKILIPKTSPAELRLIDVTIRMVTEPKFETDVPLLERGLKAERVRKKRVLQKIALSMGMLGHLHDEELLVEVQAKLKSGKRFKEFLEEWGVEIPMKPSPSNENKMIPALAKNDQGFLDLLEHENEVVAGAVGARLDTQSSILETRMDRFIKVTELCEGRLPIALRYAGADTTTRWSGTMSLNQQNLPRIIPGTPKISDVLRKSMRAPKGWKVVVADQSGIELRINMFLWKVPYAMELFRADPENADLYRYFAANTLYRISEEDVEKWQRQVGKVSHLGLGFGAGPPTFQIVAKQMGGVVLGLDESQDIVDKYRTKHAEVRNGWKTCHQALSYIHAGQESNIDPWGLCKTSPEGIVTPTGIIRYPNLHEEQGEDGRNEWWYGNGRTRARIYAGKVDENIVQHLGRNTVADNILEVAKTDIGKEFPLAHMVHDELVYVVPDAYAEEMLDTVQNIMRTPPKWWPELVVWSEGDIAQTYGDAK